MPIEQQYAGQRLGLPAAGPGSVTGWPRRILALFVDWFASLFVAALIVRSAGLGPGWSTWLPLLVFWLESAVFLALAGGSFGQLAVRLHVRRLDGGPITLPLALLRNLLICLVIPPVVYNRDNRGLHDLASGTIVVRR